MKWNNNNNMNELTISADAFLHTNYHQFGQTSNCGDKIVLCDSCDGKRKRKGKGKGEREMERRTHKVQVSINMQIHSFKIVTNHYTHQQDNQ